MEQDFAVFIMKFQNGRTGMQPVKLRTYIQ